MYDLARTLADYDIELLHILANRWDVDLNTKDQNEAAARLTDAMRDRKRVNDVWGRLSEQERQTLQAVAGGTGGRMMAAMFKRMFGDVRTMGPDRREREKPHLAPVSTAESLYYRGLIAQALDKTQKGTVPYIYVPTDLLALLPTNKTGYDTTTPAPASSELQPIDIQPENVRLADTILVDDLATYLAFCQFNTVQIIERSVSPETLKELKPYFLGTATAARLALMTALSHDLGIAAEQENAWRPLPNVRKFLELRRADQVRLLVETWLRSSTYNELWYVPGLRVDAQAGWQNDPLLARQTVLTFLENVPADKWWSVDLFIAEVKEEEPDFQRPTGDYEGLYVRDAQSGQFLQGFGHWDRIDGALLRFILVGVMNGLGLMDSAQNGTLCRLTAYGRALLNYTDWPQPKQEPPTLTITPDAVIEIPRAASRLDRFQVARFAEWTPASDPYRYKLSAVGLNQAIRQNIQPAQIQTFLTKATDGAIPEPVARLLEAWGAGGEQGMVIETMVVLRVPTPELLATIQKTPELRRFLGAPLGPTAVAVRTDQVQQFAEALQAQGLLVSVEA